MSFEDVVRQPPRGGKTAHGRMRPEYHRNPETNRDPMGDKEHARNRRRRGAKIYRKAREGKL